MTNIVRDISNMTSKEIYQFATQLSSAAPAAAELLRFNLEVAELDRIEVARLQAEKVERAMKQLEVRLESLLVPN